MSKSATTTVKQFDRIAFEKVKKLQAQKKKLSREEIMERVGFGKETVRKAMKAPNWPQYRKNERKAAKARQEKRDDGFDGLFSKQDDNEPFLPAPGEGKISKGFIPAERRAEIAKHKREIIGWTIAVLVFSLVLFLIVR